MSSRSASIGTQITELRAPARSRVTAVSSLLSARRRTPRLVSLEESRSRRFSLSAPSLGHSLNDKRPFDSG